VAVRQRRRRTTVPWFRSAERRCADDVSATESRGKRYERGQESRIGRTTRPLIHSMRAGDVAYIHVVRQRYCERVHEGEGEKAAQRERGSCVGAIGGREAMMVDAANVSV